MLDCVKLLSPQPNILSFFFGTSPMMGNLLTAVERKSSAKLRILRDSAKKVDENQCLKVV